MNIQSKLINSGVEINYNLGGSKVQVKYIVSRNDKAVLNGRKLVEGICKDYQNKLDENGYLKVNTDTKETLDNLKETNSDLLGDSFKQRHMRKFFGGSNLRYISNTIAGVTGLVALEYLVYPGVADFSINTASYIESFWKGLAFVSGPVQTVISLGGAAALAVIGAAGGFLGSNVLTLIPDYINSRKQGTKKKLRGYMDFDKALKEAEVLKTRN